MTDTLRTDDPAPSEGAAATPVEKERRMTVLFRRWPALSNREGRELRRLWDERIRRAKRRSD